MALSAAERKRNQRAREKEEREKLAALQPARPTEDQIRNRLSQHVRDLEWAQEQDALEHFYKSECRPLSQLLAIYEGADIGAKEIKDEEEAPLEKKKREVKDKQRRPNPSVDAVSIRAIELNDNGITVRINPDQFEYETLSGQKVNLRKLYEVDEVVSFRRWLDLRDKARKNLFWLCNLVNMPMFHKAHQMICDMFVQKNFDSLYFKGITRGDLPELFNKQVRVAQDGITPTKTMMLFAPREGRKSTIDGIDAVQWMLNCPDVRILIATAFRTLAKDLFGEIKGYFYLPLTGDPTAFHILFPEYVLYGRAGSSDSPVKCPAALFKSKDAHIWKTSMESASTGKRCDIRKLDDVVDYTNSNTEELRETLVRKINATGDLVVGWGFTDIVGTRYFTKDWYGTRTSKDEFGNEPEPYSCLFISAWTPKPQYRVLYDQLLKEQGGMFKVTEEMVDLWWPDSKSHNFKALLRKLKEKREISFKNQQLNIATDPKEIDLYINQFDQDVLDAHKYDRSKMPEGIEIIQCWDIAYSENSRTSDYSVGVTLGIFKNKNNEYCVVVIEVFFDKWKASELASNMIKYYEKHRPKAVYVENSNGVNFLMENIKNYAKRMGSDLVNSNGPLRVRPVSNKPNAKRERIKDVEFLLGHDRLWFVIGSWLEETFKQLTDYTGAKSTTYRKDDIPDAISLGITSHLPVTALQHNPDPKDVEKENEERQAKAAKDAHYNRVFGSSGTRLHPATSPPPLTRKQWEALRRGHPLTPPEPQVDLKPPQNPRAEQLKKLIGKILPPGMRL